LNIFEEEGILKYSVVEKFDDMRMFIGEFLGEFS